MSTPSSSSIRPATLADAPAVAGLAAELAQSFAFDRASFDASYQELIGDDDACVLVATADEQLTGYLLGFKHLTFYANGPVGWVEEILVRSERRQSGTGRALMTLVRGLGRQQRLRAGRACHPPGEALLPGDRLSGIGDLSA